MNYEYFVVEPKETKLPHIVGLYPFPIAGTIKNTGSRLQHMVDELGFPFVATDLLQQDKKLVLGRDPKQMHDPSGEEFIEMSKYRATFFGRIFADKFSKATIRVAMADSLAVPAVQGMKLHAEDHTIFDALLLRDGWNLKPPSGPLAGLGRYALYQARDKADETANKRKLTIPQTDYDLVTTQPREVGMLRTLYNVSGMMLSAENRKNAILLAGLPRLAIHTVLLSHGLSGNSAQQTAFVNDLSAARSAATASGQPSMLRAEIQYGWHSHLMDPIRGARDVKNTLQLLDSRPTN